MAAYLVEPGKMIEPGELLTPENANRIEQYKNDGIYEYSLKANGRRDKSRLKISYYEGDIFEGALHLGKYAGQGKYTWKNGGVYEGNFHHGKLSGKGTYTESNGDVYEGEFKDNKFNGAGKYTWSDGSCFEGNFKKGKLISGRYTDAAGNVFSCKFKYKFNGDRKSSNMQLIKKATYNQDKHEEKKTENKAKPKQTKSGLLSKDTKLISTIRGSKRGPEFKNLYSGAAGKSEKAEKSLISILNFFSNSDAEQIKRIFMSSKLYDPTKGQEHVTDMVTGVIKRSREYSANLKASTKAKQSSRSASSVAQNIR